MLVEMLWKMSIQLLLHEQLIVNYFDHKNVTQAFYRRYLLYVLNISVVGKYIGFSCLLCILTLILLFSVHVYNNYCFKNQPQQML